MAIIPQISLFNWENDIEILGDLERLQLILRNLPDEQLIRKLEAERGRGRDDYPVRAMWNGLLAGLIYQHRSTASLIRELNRNVQLRYLCGFTGLTKVPKAWNYSRFMVQLLKHQGELDQVFQTLIRDLCQLLPDFGKRLAMDSKFVDSFAQRKSKNLKRDGRRELDADLGMKTYHGVHPDGKPWETVVKCFGYKLHLIVDSTYDLPVAYTVTKASVPDVTEGHALVEKLKKDQPEIIQICEYLSADKGYDDGKLIQRLADPAYRIKAIIDKRKLWQAQTEKEVEGYQNVYYDEQGCVYCYDPKTQKRRTMSNDGYEASRNCLRKKCPVKAYGIRCAGYDRCSANGGVRIPLTTDRRIFTAVDRSSYKWKREYRHRTSVERVNSRLDVSLGFEEHTTRGQAKMTMKCSLALVLMLTLAAGRIRLKQPKLIRRLVKTA